MAAPSALLYDIAVVLALAAVTTLVVHRLRLPTVVGYLVAGLIVGPHALQLVRNVEATRLLAELGIVFLMFSVGLEFNLRKLLAVGPLVLVAASLEILATFWLGWTAGGWFGWGTVDRVFLGAVLSISSTTVLTKVLIELGLLRSAHAPVVFAILIVEDVVAVLVLTALSTFGVTGGVEAAVVWRTLAQVLLFLVAALAIGLVVVPRMMDAVGRMRSDEVLVISSLGLLFAVSAVAGSLGFSVALGAFLVGALVSESRYARRVEQHIVGLRDMFTAVFFVSVGMLIDPGLLGALWVPLLVVSAVAMLGKLVAVSVGTFVAGHHPATALRAGISMAVIGEFSIIIADLGDRLEITSPFLFPLVVGVALVTSLASPLLMRESDLLVRGLGRVAPSPVRTYVAFYHRWSSRLGHPGDGRLSGARRQLGRGVLQLGGFVGIAAVTQWAALWVTRETADVRLAALVWVAGALLALPFAVGFVRRGARFVRRLTDAAVPPGEHGTPAARVVRHTVGALATMALGALALAVTAPFLPSGPVVLVVLVAVGASLWFLGGAVMGLNRRVEDAIDKAVRGEAPRAPRERDELRRIIETQYPWEVETTKVTVPSDGFACGLTLRDLQVRNRTGATVAVVHRGDEHVLNPLPDWRLEGGDRLTLVGEPPQVAAAKELLRRPRAGAPEAAPSFREVEVPAASPYVGKTIAETRLRERTGATVMGIAKDGRRLPNPPPDTVLDAGDTLLLMGTADEVARASVMLREAAT